MTHSPLALRLILLVENKRERVLCYGAGFWPYPRGFPSVVEGIAAAWQSGWPSCYVTAYPTYGVRRQQSAAVCILSPVIHLTKGDSRLPSCFSTGPRDLVPLFQQRIGRHFTFILQSRKQNTYLKRIPEKTDGYKSDMANKKITSQCYDCGPS